MGVRMPIGNFAKMTGVTVRTLHYYDELGLLKPEVSPSRRRFYEDHHFMTLQKIVTLKFLGFSLEQIKQLLQKENWNLKESLHFQRTIMLQKKAQIEHVIKALDSALNIVEEEHEVDSSIFISIINGILSEDDHKEFLKTVFSEEKVNAIYNLSQDEQHQLEKKWALLLAELKKVCGGDPEDADAQILMKDMFTMFSEVVGEDTSVILQLTKADLPEEQVQTPLPFTQKEEDWIAQAMRIYLKNEGIEWKDSDN